MYVYRRLANVRRAAFWVATTLYVCTFPFIILNVTGIEIRPRQARPFVQTGALEVVTRPEGSDLVVDGLRSRSPTPAVVEGLRPGRHEIAIEWQGSAVWRGSVDVAPGEVTSLRGLPVAPPAVTRITLPAGPVLSARRSLVSPSMLVAVAGEPGFVVLDLGSGRLLAPRGASARGTVSRIVPLVSDAEFLVQTDVEGDAAGLLLDQSALGGWSATELPFGIPPGCVVLAGSWRERAVMFLDGERIVHRGAAGDRTLLVMSEPVVATGATAGGVLLLDKSGALHHQARFLAPKPVAAFAMGGLSLLGGGEIVAHKGPVLVVQAGTSLFLLTRSRSVEIPGVGGAVFDEARERIIVWSADRVGRLDDPWIEAEEKRPGSAVREPTLTWILQAESRVEGVAPLRDGDVVLIRTERSVLAGVLGERTLLEPVPVASGEPGGVTPVVDPAGVVVMPSGPDSLDVLRLWPASQQAGEPR